MKYAAKDLNDIADWLDECARLDLDRSGFMTAELQSFHQGSAYAHKNVADMLRNTFFEEPKS